MDRENRDCEDEGGDWMEDVAGWNLKDEGRKVCADLGLVGGWGER